MCADQICCVAVSQVIIALKVKGSSKGVSRAAIKKGLGDVSAARVNLSLKKAVAAGKLIQVKDSYKVRGVRACVLSSLGF